MAEQAGTRGVREDSFAELPKSARPAIASARIVRPIDRTQIASVTVKLRPRRPFSELEATLSAIYARPPQRGPI